MQAVGHTRLCGYCFVTTPSQFQSPTSAGVPGQIELGRLLQITERIFNDEETDEDLQMIFAPGSSLGGARPKASVVDQHGRLAIAKFPKETDDYSIEVWESVALRLAARAGIRRDRRDADDEHDRASDAERPARRACRIRDETA